MNENKSFLLVEKYRPVSVADCILPKRIKDQINGFISKKEIPHLMFYGTAGLGKTSLAKAICNDISADCMYINASSETGVDVVRNKITQFASTSSFDGNLKVVILDEFDRMGAHAMDSLKSTQEAFHQSTRFIFTSNNIHKIIDPIRSRCIEFDFNPTQDEKTDMMVQALKRVMTILKKEEIEFDVKSVVSLLQKYYPDLRKTINEIQRYASTGKIDSGILVQPETSIDELVANMKGKKFNDIRKWLARNADTDQNIIFRYFYDNLSLFDGKSIPVVILILADFQYKSAFVVDQEINTMACLIEIVQGAEFK
jgi:DNA polymerase III delta prime subunit